jgi:malate synthase
MNMPAFQNKQIHPSFYSFINEEVLPLVDLSINQFWDDFDALKKRYKTSSDQVVVPISSDLLALNVTNSHWDSLLNEHSSIDAKSFLDEHFGLVDGSHKDVKSYVVYYHHLLAFFADGTQSGLANPKQFVALCGHKCSPDSIVLKQDNFHLEIVIDKTGDIGANDQANIQDIRIETIRTATIDFDTLSTCSSGEANMQAYRMLKDILSMERKKCSKTSGERCTPDTDFTAPNGEEYVITGRDISLVGKSQSLAVSA